MTFTGSVLPSYFEVETYSGSFKSRTKTEQSVFSPAQISVAFLCRRRDLNITCSVQVSDFLRNRNFLKITGTSSSPSRKCRRALSLRHCASLVPEAGLESYRFGTPRRFRRAETSAGFSSPSARASLTSVTLCRRRDLNPHTFRYTILSRARLPLRHSGKQTSSINSHIFSHFLRSARLRRSKSLIRSAHKCLRPRLAVSQSFDMAFDLAALVKFHFTNPAPHAATITPLRHEESLLYSP